MNIRYAAVAIVTLLALLVGSGFGQTKPEDRPRSNLSGIKTDWPQTQPTRVAVTELPPATQPTRVVVTELPPVTQPTRVVVAELPPATQPIGVRVIDDEKPFLNSLKEQLVPTLIALITAVLGFLASQWFERYKKEENESETYKITLNSILNELKFYEPLFRQLSTDLDKIVADVATPKPPTLPSYSLYPGLLEQAKVRLLEFARDSAIAEHVAECHFELAHLSERIDWLKDHAQAWQDQSFPGNVQSIKDQADHDITVFGKAREMIETALDPKSRKAH